MCHTLVLVMFLQMFLFARHPWHQHIYHPVSCLPYLALFFKYRFAAHRLSSVLSTRLTRRKSKFKHCFSNSVERHGFCSRVSPRILIWHSMDPILLFRSFQDYIILHKDQLLLQVLIQWEYQTAPIPPHTSKGLVPLQGAYHTAILLPTQSKLYIICVDIVEM